MTDDLNERQLAVLAYGSLLAHPGEWLGRNMEKLIRCETPFGVEYLGQASSRRGGAPTLVRSEDGKRVKGGLIVLPYFDVPEQLEKVRKQLALRETGQVRSSYVKDDLDMEGFRVVYSNFEPHFESSRIDLIAQAAIESVPKCLEKGHPFMNGIRYLHENIEWGVETTLTNDYKKLVLEKVSKGSLPEAEHALLVDPSLANRIFPDHASREEG